MDDAEAEAELPGENTAMLRENDMSEPEDVAASAPAVSDVAPVELPSDTEPDNGEPADVPESSPGGPEPGVELPPPPEVEQPSDSVSIPEPEMIDLPDAGIGEFFKDANWQPPENFGDLPEIEDMIPDEGGPGESMMDDIALLDRGGGW